MVVLSDIGHPKIQAHLVQKRRLRQLYTLGLEITRHVKHQAVSAFCKLALS